MATGASWEVQLARRPVGLPKESDFRLVQVPLRELGPNEVLVRNSWLSVDPYMRLRMDEDNPYGDPYELDEALEGEALGEVVASTSDRFRPGALVRHDLGWRERAVVAADRTQPVDVGAAPPSAALSILGWPGFTAHVGLLDVAQLRDDDVVFVSGAAGAVGSAAGQIAKLRGHRVIGSAGSDEKVRHLVEELGFDAAFNYRSGSVTQLLRRAAPDGIDVYFDNVGGDHLEAAIDCMSDHGRVAMCGAISGYSAVEPQGGPRNLFTVVARQLRLQGFLVEDDAARWERFVSEVRPWVQEGKIAYRETVLEGIDNTVPAFVGMLQGANTGKMLVRLG